jgi:hypothetical protein
MLGQQKLHGFPHEFALVLAGALLELLERGEVRFGDAAAHRGRGSQRLLANTLARKVEVVEGTGLAAARPNAAFRDAPAD